MKLIDYCIRQPISVAVGVGLSLLAGVLAFTNVPVEMKPEVDSVVISVATQWESASAEEIESDIVEEQEKVLGDIAGLMALTALPAQPTQAARATWVIPARRRNRHPAAMKAQSGSAT